MCDLPDSFVLEEIVKEKVSVKECLDYAKEVLEVLPQGEVEELKGYQAKWLVVELVAEVLGGRVNWDWQNS